MPNKFPYLAIALIFTLAFASCKDDGYTTEPPKIYFSSDGVYEIGPTDTLLLEPRIIYDSGSTYQWTDADGNLLSNELNYEFIPSAMKDYNFTFKVSNSLGEDSYDICVSVLINATFSDIENYSTKKTGVLALMPDTLQGAFICEGIKFLNDYNADTTMWYGFAFSNIVSTKSTISSSAIGIAYISGSTTANCYMAAYNYADDAIVTFPCAYTPRSVDLANDNFIYLASKFGYMTTDSVTTSPVAQNDFYTVVIEGLDQDGQVDGSRVEYDLIACNYDNPAKYVRQTAWCTVDLRTLGQVYGLKFSVETSTDYPHLFCLDNLRVQD